MPTKHIMIRDHRASGAGFEMEIDGHTVGDVIAYKVEADCRESETFYPRVTVTLAHCSVTLDMQKPLKDAAHGD